MPVIICNGKAYAGSEGDMKDKTVAFESGHGMDPGSPADAGAAG